MNDKAIDDQELTKWDPEFTKLLANLFAPVVKRWFRAEVKGLENVPPVGGALMVSNHSGGVQFGESTSRTAMHPAAMSWLLAISRLPLGCRRRPWPPYR
ncbi:hypothetical protein [Mycobacterium sp.]|uniref:hypothetical protein n=1 Tax=Mycobacterium sp. TaxID=1785 RepID=UPI003F9495D6